MGKRSIERLAEIYRTIKFETKAYLISAIGRIKSSLLLKPTNINKLEIGVGNSAKKQGFITSDLSLSTDFPHDLRLGLPFPDQSIDFIYSEHVLEHFSYNDLLFLLEDCHRVLKPNGMFSMVVPDPTIYLKAYFHSDPLEVKKYCSYDWGLDYSSKMDYVNYIFYMDGQHRYMFDRESIVQILSKVGFQDASSREFDPQLDREDRKYQSLYARATK
ncbi:class I SAM-dependent methyltransferase [Roseofilum casamattae]|uniref:Methyltransferase domain-containing protein n=1 Tax=Roseofilum casamattae BLCC-M143 TaxID=3022442 RepID=A0ABT7C186_9CYAN|nr:methyltransferase domain-containing protein [Roseofilum casamattae]MDJ1184822.1 methyltransferase domain-containing protein [Roseofilum casamattae BLCC-M143]